MSLIINQSNKWQETILGVRAFLKEPSATVPADSAEYDQNIGLAVTINRARWTECVKEIIEAGCLDDLKWVRSQGLYWDSLGLSLVFCAVEEEQWAIADWLLEVNGVMPESIVLTMTNKLWPEEALINKTLSYQVMWLDRQQIKKHAHEYMGQLISKAERGRL